MTAPSDREVFLNEVREALEADLWEQHLLTNRPDRYIEWVDTQRASQAAVDAMVRHMGPEF